MRCVAPASRGVPRFSPTKGMGCNCRPLPCAVRCARTPNVERLAQTSKWKSLHRTAPPRISGEPRRWIRRTPHNVDPRGARAFERGDALPPVSTAATATPEGTDPALERDLSERGQLKPGGADLGVTEGSQTAGNRGAYVCTYCGRGLEDSTEDSAVDSFWVCIPCPHGEQVHACRRLDSTERLARRHADPQPYITCRSEWPARNRPPHPAEMAEDLPRPLPGVRWPGVGGARKFAELIEEDGARMLQPASFVTISSHKSFELMVRTRGRSPTSSFLLCSMFSDALSQTQRDFLDFPRPRGWQAAASHYREVFATYAILAQDVLLRLPSPRVYDVLSHVQEFRAGLDSTRGDRLTR